MNYQFIHDYLNQPLAQFDMGNEAFSRWFSDELGRDPKKLNHIRQAIVQLQGEQAKEIAIHGDEMILLMNTEEVQVRANILDSDETDTLPEGTELYEQELMAECGLEDFIQVFDSWSEFVAP